ncbi:MAG: NAD(P)/FAD-dependent oxidoreductase [Gemmataceae bacterium]
MLDVWDAVVIGAGPAGAVSARELARSGCRTLLLDRAKFPRNKVCGCCLNGSALASLRRLGLGSIAESGVRLNDIMLAAGSARATLRLTAGVAMSRALFDQALVDAARECGAAFRDGTTAKLESRTSEGATVQVNGDTVAARVVVLATGLGGGESEVQPGSRIGGGVVLRPEMAPDFYKADRLFMATGKGGYVGLVRLADGSLDVAAAFDADFVRSCGGLAAAANALLQRSAWPALPEANWKGTPALTRHRTEVAEDRLFAVGDATGYVEPFTGEGMAWAIASAAALAPIAARAAGEWNDDFIAEWRRTHARIVGRRQRFCRAAARVLRSPALTKLAVQALGLAPVLARPFVASLNRPSRFPGSTA